MKSMCLIWSDGAVAKHKNIMCICLVVLISLWSDLCCLDVSWHLSAFLANAALCWQFSSTSISTWTLFKVPVHDNVIGRHFYTNKQQRRSRGQQNKTKQNRTLRARWRWGEEDRSTSRSGPCKASRSTTSLTGSQELWGVLYKGKVPIPTEPLFFHSILMPDLTLLTLRRAGREPHLHPYKTCGQQRCEELIKQTGVDVFHLKILHIKGVMKLYFCPELYEEALPRLLLLIMVMSFWIDVNQS